MSLPLIVPTPAPVLHMVLGGSRVEASKQLADWGGEKACVCASVCVSVWCARPAGMCVCVLVYVRACERAGAKEGEQVERVRMGGQKGPRTGRTQGAHPWLALPLYPCRHFIWGGGGRNQLGGTEGREGGLENSWRLGPKISWGWGGERMGEGEAKK